MDFTVGIDAWPALRHAPGLGRYSRELVRALIDTKEVPRLKLFEVGPGRPSLAESTLGSPERLARLARLRLPLPRRIVSWTARLGYGAETWLGNIDLFHRVFAASPAVRRVPELVPVFEWPARNSPAERMLVDHLRRIRHVLVVSRAAEHGVLERVGLAERDVHRVSVACTHWARELTHPVLKSDPPRLLALGAVSHARRSPLLVRSSMQLAARGLAHELVLCGHAGDAADETRVELARNRHARWIESPIEADLPTLVASSRLLVHLNDADWTAVTPLEALSLGTAVLTSRTPTFEDALGVHANFVESTAIASDESELGRAIESALRKDGDVAAARAHAGRFSWGGHARETVGVWRRILGR